MKVKFLKSHELGSNQFEVGESYEVINSLAESWINDGICEQDNSVPLPKETEEIDEEGERVLNELPDNAADLVKAIPEVSNIYALEELAEDDRKTVREAAEARLEEL